jgi:XTP/dITP diphosphohydrolase
VSAQTLKLVLATHNSHKVTELRKILGDKLAGIDLIGYDGPEPVEDGDTFAANALIKARAAAAFTGLPAIADDSGISVDALDGAPGIHSARYAGNRDDRENLELLLTNLAALGEGVDRSAHFTCAAAFVSGAGSASGPGSGSGYVEHVEVAIWPGSVLPQRAGEGGFGYDPIFLPDGVDVSAAELSAEQKNAISHRTLAFTQLLPFVRETLL